MGFYLNSCLYGISCKFAAEGACREALAAFFFSLFFFLLVAVRPDLHVLVLEILFTRFGVVDVLARRFVSC